MIWHTDTSQRRISFGGILAVFILAVVLLTFATHVAGETPPAQGTMYVECSPLYCQVDVLYPGQEPVEFVVRRVVNTEVRS